MRRWISLGSWCGPTLMLSKLGLRSPDATSLPFEAARCTMDGIIHFLHHGFQDGYFPDHQRPYTPDPASIWLLFRGTHTCFTHFDLNTDAVMAEMHQRIEAWEELMQPNDGSRTPQRITFLRTVLAENPQEELDLLPDFHAAVRQRTRGTMDFRTVVVVHNQAPTTQPIFSFHKEAEHHNSPCVVWNLARHAPSNNSHEVGGADPSSSTPSLLDECHDGYQHIITSMCKELKWRSLAADLPTYAQFLAAAERSGAAAFRPYAELSRVAGVPAVRGSCRGVGSTAFARNGGICAYCGSTNGHAVAPEAFDVKKPWSDADIDALLLAYGMHNGDEVAAVEATALAQSRGAHETWLQLKELIGGSET